MSTVKKSPFSLGYVVATAGIDAVCRGDREFHNHVLACIGRHRRGDWGDLDAEDRETNEKGTPGETATRLLSAYESPEHPKIWIITEWDRSVTTVLFPDEY